MQNIHLRLSLLLLCCAVLYNASPALAQKKVLRLKVMSYNIHHGNPPSQPNTINTDTIGSLIAKYQPDLVALQEVDVHTTRSGKELDEAIAALKPLVRGRKRYRSARGRRSVPPDAAIRQGTGANTRQSAKIIQFPSKSPRVSVEKNRSRTGPVSR